MYDCSHGGAAWETSIMYLQLELAGVQNHQHKALAVTFHHSKPFQE